MERIILIASAGVGIGMSAAVAFLYVKLIRASKAGRSKPVHVAMVSMAYCGLLVLLALDRLELYQKNAPVTWRTYAFIAVIWLGNAAIFLILQHLRRARQAAR